MRILILTMAIVLLAVQGRLWLSDQGLPELHRLQAELAGQREENAELRRRNDALAAEVEDLRDGLEAAEERARSDLGMVRENETFYQLVLPEHSRADLY